LDEAAPAGIDPSALIGERIADRFVIERAIGQGPLSSAFRAHDDRLHRRVTVKLFHPRHRDDTHVVKSQLAAARSVARLSHENVAMVIDQGEHAGLPLVVFEYVRGENLQERIERYAPLAAGEVVTYGLQIARALTYAHGHGVVHGNVRPANVLLTEDRDVKLVDFGGGSYVAQLVGDPFAAPELSQVDADTPAEPTDDIYALGAVLFSALTEHPPAPDVESVELQLLRPDISIRLADTVTRCLTSDPHQRFLSMREIAAELAATNEQTIHDRAGTGSTRAFGAVPIGEPTEAFDVVGDAHGQGEDTAVQAATEPRMRQARPRARRTATRRERRARALAWGMVLVPIAALVIIGVMIAGERAKKPQEKIDPRATGPVHEIGISSVESFDPEPDGDGEEHAQFVANIIDGDTTTTWETEGYDTPTFAGLKKGVGVVVQLKEPADVRDVQLFTRLPNWRVQIYAAATPAQALSGWTPVSDVTAVRDGAKIPVDMRDVKLGALPDGRTGALLLWVTKLALDVDDASKDRARLAEVIVHGATDR
jgi:serine/threonine-protein kinase